MKLFHERTQFAVGQGFFHAGEIYREPSKTPNIRYVVDCGSVTNYAKERNNRIDFYIKSFGKENKLLDLLFISHAHADHLNGVERLLDSCSGLKVKTIILPLLSIEDRLIAFARAAVEDLSSAMSDFYVDFVVDPVATVSRFKPDVIVLIAPSNDRRAPYSKESNERVDDPKSSENEKDAINQLPGKLVGSGIITSHESQQSGRILNIPDSIGLLVEGDSSVPDWLLAPYVDKVIASSQAEFMKILRRKLKGKMGGMVLKDWLAETANIKELLTAHLNHLKAAYTEVSHDLNVTSMSLYSGPKPESGSSLRIRHELKTGCASHDNTGCAYYCHCHYYGNQRMAWLGSADASLGNKKRLQNFLSHYGALLEKVSTFTLPHHGSDHNFDLKLLQQIQPCFCIAAADQYSNWRHPGTHVIQSVASMGIPLCVVTSSLASEMTERLITFF